MTRPAWRSPRPREKWKQNDELLPVRDRPLEPFHEREKAVWLLLLASLDIILAVHAENAIDDGLGRGSKFIFGERHEHLGRVGVRPVANGVSIKSVVCRRANCPDQTAGVAGDPTKDAMLVRWHHARDYTRSTRNNFMNCYLRPDVAIARSRRKRPECRRGRSPQASEPHLFP
ncbi:MAG: hypothetical protein JWO48_1208 [Bryobacterales bacterium]|nr:hypothetical protein [Bryobacterales bacterium]